jgi:hypothetical protein
MTNSELPPSFENVMITYKKVFGTGPYRDTKEIREITKMGFYSDLFMNFAIPPEYRYFRMGKENVLLPHGWGGDHLTPDKIIKWEPITQKS